jgi:hypothetical protein
MTPFDAPTRRRLLDEYFANRARLDRPDPSRAPSPEEAGELKRLRARQSELLRAYRDGLPQVPLSRCPFTQAVYSPAFDPFGLDGPWWDYYAGQRPFAEPPTHWIALTGAMQLDPVLDDVPFLRIPGPAVPYVHPRLLECDGVKAVLYSLPVGRHAAFPIVYFAAEWPAGVRMPNLWGASFYRTFSGAGDTGWYETYDRAADRDFDLAKWIEAGKLLWISPGDPEMALQPSAAGCPYLNLPGARGVQRIYGSRLEVANPSEEIPR